MPCTTMQSVFTTLLTTISIICPPYGTTARDQRPHIVFIVADDLGWNDVGFHGSSQIPTPNIDALAYSGVILNNYYVTPICTPSRSAIMTGKHPIHTGMQHTVLFGAEPRGLPLTEKLLPQYLKDLGYVTRLVGKWHLGSYKLEYTPTYRGFDSHLGFWTGRIDYFDHTSVEIPSWGLDMRKNTEVAWDLHGQYCTDLFTKEAVRLINTHNSTKPLFLYVAHSAVHSGNPYNPLPAPDEAIAPFFNITDISRRKFAGMMSKLDESVGQIVQALQSTKMLDDTIIVFTTDNGGPAAGFNFNAASNWPLRGVKNTLWEGGVRGAGLVFSPLISKPMRVSTQMMHITDWLPTLYEAVGGKVSDLGKIDGLSQWAAISQDADSPRNEVLHNIDDIYGNAALTVGEWKILKGTTYGGTWDSWYGPSGREGFYNTTLIKYSPAGRSLSAMNRLANVSQMEVLRKEAEVHCSREKSPVETVPCKPLKAACLFNVVQDPCEKRNLANVYPDVLNHLQRSLDQWNKTAIPPSNLPLDPRADPRFWDHVWSNFGDYITVPLSNSAN